MHNSTCSILVGVLYGATGVGDEAAIGQSRSVGAAVFVDVVPAEAKSHPFTMRPDEGKLEASVK